MLLLPSANVAVPPRIHGYLRQAPAELQVARPCSAAESPAKVRPRQSCRGAAAVIKRSGSQAEESMRKSGHWATGTVLFLLCLMYGITYIDRVNISTAAIAFRQELNLTNIQYGWIFSAFAYTYALFQIV